MTGIFPDVEATFITGNTLTGKNTMGSIPCMMSLSRWLLVGILATVDLGSGGLLKVMDVAVSAAEPSGSKSPRPWKIDIDILHSANYEGHYVTFSKGHLHVDQEDRLWMPLDVYFPGKEQNTDAWAPLVR